MHFVQIRWLVYLSMISQAVGERWLSRAVFHTSTIVCTDLCTHAHLYTQTQTFTHVYTHTHRCMYKHTHPQVKIKNEELCLAPNFPQHKDSHRSHRDKLLRHTLRLHRHLLPPDFPSYIHVEFADWRQFDLLWIIKPRPPHFIARTVPPLTNDNQSLLLR